MGLVGRGRGFGAGFGNPDVSRQGFSDDSLVIETSIFLLFLK